ncbi:MAG: hypothetical protein B6242_12235 [Anaerolineaceae bacterium 4572_78]|nr:MAG: hypothetical protein B6242_12235 [Anaerolineaceae bacterium 4572_78]
MITISGYEIQQKIYESEYSIIYRGTRRVDNKAVILKTLKEDYPSLELVAWFKREYEILSQLDMPGVIKTYDLNHESLRWIIVLEDFGGESLTILMQSRPFSLVEFLYIAIAITEIMGNIHHQHIVHKDINPTNIVFNPKTKVVKLIDFGISIVLSHEASQSHASNIAEGTLPYMSPEQTGRINQKIDHRTDFYSLGATFYELLTGQTPFPKVDMVTTIHAHLAKTPVLPHDIDLDIPPIISDIVLKLMAKHVDNRYQSAVGLKADLSECLRQFEKDSNITPFPLGRHDTLEQFQISPKLYGRGKEINKLMSAFEIARRGKSKMVLISGDMGIGKSSLVEEIEPLVTKKHGVLITGRFDQFHQNVPYSAIVNAFHNIIHRLLTKDESRLAYWRQAILDAVGEHVQVIIDFIPEVALMIDSQSTATSSRQTVSTHRFNVIFQHFISAFCHVDHPLVIFLDNLQWADSATLRLITAIMTNKYAQYLLLIGAYRHDEVPATHSLMTTIKKVSKKNKRTVIDNIHLEPLKIEDIAQLVADTLYTKQALSLQQDTQEVMSLAQLIVDKTLGNPFFVNEFLKALYQKGFLVFSHVKASIDAPEQRQLSCWEWDLTEIEKVRITDNVVDLMIDKLQQLPAETQHVLSLAACVGDHFDLKTVSVINNQSKSDTYHLMLPAIHTGLILPSSTSPFYPLIQETTSTLFIVNYKFSHNKVQQSIYQLIDSESLQQVHFRIAKLWLEQTPPDNLEGILFEIVTHFSMGYECVTNQDEKYQIAKLNLLAGQKAKATTAYLPAIAYLSIGLSILMENSSEQIMWKDAYHLTLSIYMETIEVTYLNGNFDLAIRLSEISLPYVKTIQEKVKIYQLQIQSYAAQNQLQQADTRILAGMDILQSISSPVYSINPNLFSKLAFTMVNLSIKHGHCPSSAVGYTFYGLILCSFKGNIKGGCQFGQLALQLIKKFEVRKLKTRVYTLYYTTMHHWKAHLRETIAGFEESMYIGMETGEHEYASYSGKNRLVNLFLTGENLIVIKDQYDVFMDIIHNIKHAYSLYQIHIWGMLLQRLIGESATDMDLPGHTTELVQNLKEANDQTSLFAFHLTNMIEHYMFGNYDKAIEHAMLASPYHDSAKGMVTSVTYNFYHSLILLALALCGRETAPTAKDLSFARQVVQVSLPEKVATNQMQMKIWALHAPMNRQHKYDLVMAEESRLSQKPLQAMEYYDAAIQGARTHGYKQEMALAYERASLFYVELGRIEIAQSYMTKAYNGYVRWGAMSKAEQLIAKYPDMVSRLSSIQPVNTQLATTIASSGTSAGIMLDMETVMKASQAIASEVILSNLLEKMMRLIVENAGAQRGVFILPQDGQWLIESEACVLNNEVQIFQAIPFDMFPEDGDIPLVPNTIINYVIRTQEEVVLDNASIQGQFSHDTYIRQQKTKAVVCIPLINQGRANGIIYLENNLSTGVFTPARLAVLHLLALQMAVSLDNAVMYNDLEKYRDHLAELVDERTRRLEFVAELFTQLNAKLELDELLKEIVNQVKTSFGYYHVHIYLLDESGKNLVIAEGTGIAGRQMKEDKHGIPLNAMTSLVARAARSEKVVMIENVRQSTEWLPNPLLPDTHSEIAVPIVKEGKVIGILDVQNDEIGSLDEGDINLLRSLASEVGIAIYNARLFGMVQKANEELARLNADKDKFFSILAHDLKNPFQPLLGYAEVLAMMYEDITPAEVKEIGETMRDAAQKAYKLLEDLLTWSRLQMGRMKYQPNSLNLAKLVEQTVELLQEIAVTKNIILNSIILPNMIIYADKFMIDMVIRNVTSNALKFTENGGAVTISAKRCLPDNENDSRFIEVSVSDTGVGIEEENLGKLFKIDVHHSTTGTAEESGTGLGLIMCKEMIEHHGGKIWVESIIGEGTVMRFTVPEIGHQK